MAYKVLTDGNGSKLIRVVGMGDYMPLKDYEALRLERDALAMKFEKVKEAYKNLCGVIGDADDTEQGTKEHDDATGEMFEVMREGWQHVND